ncbi:MAG: hypothetical protein IPM77_00665 [Crocinitomicaceae bacterium]|nr:hypothetical protein [Crocinitomicaceae bacterium]
MQTDQPGSLKDKFGGFGAAPTDQLWNAIENKLDQKEKKRRGAFWWWFTSMAAGLTFLFLVFRFGYELGKKENQHSDIVKQEVEISNQQLPENSDVIRKEDPADESVLNTAANNLSEEKNENQLNNSDSKNQHPVKNQIDKDTDEQKILIVEQDVKIPLKEVALIEEAELKKLKGSEIRTIDNVNDIPFELNTVAIERQKTAGKWEIGFSAGSLASVESPGKKMFLDQNTLTTADNLNQENAIQGLEFASYNSLTETVAKIYRPVFFEFNASRSLGKNGILRVVSD